MSSQSPNSSLDGPKVALEKAKENALHRKLLSYVATALATGLVWNLFGLSVLRRVGVGVPCGLEAGSRQGDWASRYCCLYFSEIGHWL